MAPLSRFQRRSIRLPGYDYAQPGAYFVTLVAAQCAEIFGALMAGRVALSALGQIVQAEWRRSAAIRREIQLWDDEFVIMPNHMHAIVWIVSPGDGARDDDRGACHAPLRGGGPFGILPGDGGMNPTGEGVHDGTRGAYHAPLRDGGTFGVGADGIRPGDGGMNHAGDGARDDDRGACHAPLRDGDMHDVGADGIRPGNGGTSIAGESDVGDTRAACHAPRPDGDVHDVGADGIRPGDGGTNPAGDDLSPAMPRRAGRSLASFIAGFKGAVSGRARRECALAQVWQRNYYEHIIRSPLELEQIRMYMEDNPRRWAEDRFCPPVLKKQEPT